MGGNNKEALQRENTIRFIEAAEELIDEHGIDNVSVRKIAEGFNWEFLLCMEILRRIYVKESEDLL